MSQRVAGPIRTFTAGLAIVKHIRVTLTAGKLAIAGAADDDLGEITEEAFADSDMRSVELRNGPGTRKMVAAGAVAADVVVYKAAAGKVDDVNNGQVIGISMESAAAVNEVFEVLPLSPGAQALLTTIADPTGGGTVDTEGRAAIDLIIDRLQSVGIIV